MKKGFNLFSFFITPLGFIIFLLVVFKISKFKNWFFNLFFKITDNSAKSKARSLFLAMQGFGTDEGTIFKVLDNISEKEYLDIYNEFGLKGYNSDLGVQLIDPFQENFDLHQWLQNELNTVERLRLRNSLPYLSKYGI